MLYVINRFIMFRKPDSAIFSGDRCPKLIGSRAIVSIKPAA